MNDVLGRPVTGEISESTEGRFEQRSGEEFLPLLDAVLASETVDAIRWSQFTPYFNDGEACVFGVQRAQVKLAGDETSDCDEDGYLAAYEMVEHRRDQSGRSRIIKPQYEGVYPALRTLEESLGHFEDFLRDSFGDHAQVTATREGFHVDFFEHD